MRKQINMFLMEEEEEAALKEWNESKKMEET
jgi:hypothetical protein